MAAQNIIIINGNEFAFESGETILEVARRNDIDIPTLCHDPHLASIGACRICLVEDERSGRLSASCVTPIESGMVINTESDKVRERRSTIIRLIECNQIKPIPTKTSEAFMQIRKLFQVKQPCGDFVRKAMLCWLQTMMQHLAAV